MEFGNGIHVINMLAKMLFKIDPKGQNVFLNQTKCLTVYVMHSSKLQIMHRCSFERGSHFVPHLPRLVGWEWRTTASDKKTLLVIIYR